MLYKMKTLYKHICFSSIFICGSKQRSDGRDWSKKMPPTLDFVEKPKLGSGPGAICVSPVEKHSYISLEFVYMTLQKSPIKLNRHLLLTSSFYVKSVQLPIAISV
jgi:hypothetical protein